MPRATIEVSPPPPSLNETNRGRNPKLKHKRKRQTQGVIAQLLLAAGVPRPIPGGKARATALILFPTARRRDEDNFRSGLSKAFGDALAPAPTKEEQAHGLAPAFVWLEDDTPEHFTFGTVEFGLTERGYDGARRPAVAIVTLSWGDSLLEDLEAEHAALRAALGPGGEPPA